MATSEHVDTMKSSSMEVSVWRGDHDGGAFSTYTVPRQASQTVLDVVVWIQQNADPTLAYRYACRVGMCGSCAMTVNGRPRWTCRTHIQVVGDNGLEIAPLQNLPVIRDLAVDMTEFFDKWPPKGCSSRPRRGTSRSNPSSPKAQPVSQQQPGSNASTAPSATPLESRLSRPRRTEPRLDTSE